MKAAQVSATEAGNNWIGFVIHHAPCPMLAVLPTVEMAKRASRGRLDPLISDSPALRERVSPAPRCRQFDSVQGIPGWHPRPDRGKQRDGPAVHAGALPVSRRDRRLSPSADEEGDPVTLAEARTTTFAHRRKVFLVSTPTIRGLSRIEQEFDASDQRRYFVPCPHCGAMQWLEF